MFRDGLRALLEKQRELDVEVVAEADNGRSAVRMTAELRPQIVIMDIGMPDLNGIEATREITRGESGARVIALSMQSDGPVIRRMFQAGVSAYLLKDCAFDELVKAVRAVLAGRTYLSSEITGVVIKQLASAPDASTQPLTPKEREVLQLVAEGKSNKEIAQLLSLSTKTIDTHRQHIMDKLNIHNTAELTRYAIREGISFLEGPRPAGEST
jgi:two-component system response regulator NreC